MTALVRSPRRGLEKAVTAEMEAIQARSVVAVAREVARIDGISAVAHRAALSVDQLSTIEAALIRRRPDERAEMRLRYICDTAATAIGNVLLDLDRRL